MANLGAHPRQANTIPAIPRPHAFSGPAGKPGLESERSAHQATRPGSFPAGTASSLSAFGLALQVDFALPGAGSAPAETAGPRPLAVTEAAPEQLFELTAEARFLRHLQVNEGCPFATLQGPAGDILFHYGWRALFHLSSDLGVLQCAFTAGDRRSSERFLLDTVLWTVSLARGLHLLHAGAVSTPAGVVAFAAQTGGGKTSLVVECLRRGARLFADDVVALEASDGRVVAHPGPPVMNVPARLGARAVADSRCLADFGDEHWVCLDAAPPTPAPLAAIVLLSRAPDLPLRCTPVQASSLTLLPLTISLPHVTPSARERFEVFGHLAARTPVLSLTADPSVTPADLADAVEKRVSLR